MELKLDGVWRLKRWDPDAPMDEVFSPAFLPEGWLEVPVPGDVRTALSARGLIDGYYLGKALDQERWIDRSDWLYYLRFTPPSDKKGLPFLCFLGVDTLAEVWLNGQQLGACDNMFTPWCFPVSDVLKPGDNILVVRIRSTVHALAGRDRTGLYPEDDTDRLMLRKSQMNFGWDFCGHCLTHGLWKSVLLRWVEDAQLDAPYLRTESLEDGAAVLALDVGLKCYTPPLNTQGLTVRLRIWQDATLCLEETWPMESRLTARLRLSQPRLWWPRPYGEPFLYHAEIALLRDQQIIDQHQFRLGVRVIELLQSPLPQGGRRFTFRVNGRELFIRGANWVPLHAVYAQIDPAEEQFFLRKAVEANLSMLRIWGGGIYESESFFDFCDANGLLIMQDFMLACGVLPQDEAFLAQVHREVCWAVRHYRQRACLAIWSADNELDEAYRWYDMLDQFPTNKVNRVAVRTAVEQEDPYRPFLVSSPCSPFPQEAGGDDPNSPLQGDMHVYLTRFSADSPYYYKKLLEFVPRFMSEYGFSSLPCRDSYEKFNFFHKRLDMTANPWLGELPAFQQMCDEDSIDDMIYFTQYTQARGLQYWIEYMRTHKGVCGGSLYWKFNDPVAPNRENMLFPSLMSVIDFYGMPKLAFDYARRAYEDVILAFREEEGKLLVFGCNETLQAYTGELCLYWMDHSGEKRLLARCQGTIEADCATQLASWTPEAEAKPGAGYYKAVFTGDIALWNRFFPGDIADYVGVRPSQAHLSGRIVSRCGNELDVEITTDHFAQDVCLCALDKSAQYSDNAFDMDAGEVRRVRVTLPAGMPLRLSACNADPILLESLSVTYKE